MAHKKYAEAEPLLLSGFNGMQERAAAIPTANKPRLGKAVQRLIRLYDETERPENAVAWRQKLGELMSSVRAPGEGTQRRHK
jgi:hypothetical protein